MKQISILILALSAFINISVKAQFPNTLTPADKVYGLSKFWEEVNYNFVYLDRIDRRKWDSIYKVLITTIQKTENDYQYYCELQKFCALLKDGHTDILYPKGMLNTFTSMFGEYRLFLTNIDGKAIIIRTNLSKKNEIPPGSEVIEVNGEPTQKYIDGKVAPYICSSTDYFTQDVSIQYLLTGFEGDTYNIKIKKPSGEIISLSLTHKKTEEKEVFPEFEPETGLLNFKWYNNNKIAYVALNAFDDRKIDSLFVDKLPELYKAKALVIDLRNNGGGSTNIGLAILEYLTSDTLLYGSRSSSRMTIPTYKAWGKNVEAKDTLHDAEAKKCFLSYHDNLFYSFDYQPDTVKLKTRRIVVPTVILTGHYTASAAEDFLIYSTNQKHIIKIGERSYGSTGQPLMIDLPGGGGAKICTKHDTYPDGTEFVGYGVKPDIEVTPTVTDYIEKKDPALERALEYLKYRIN